MSFTGRRMTVGGGGGKERDGASDGGMCKPDPEVAQPDKRSERAKPSVKKGRAFMHLL
jgi:hypothetical protein